MFMTSITRRSVTIRQRIQIIEACVAHMREKNFQSFSIATDFPDDTAIITFRRGAEFHRYFMLPITNVDLLKQALRQPKFVSVDTYSYETNPAWQHCQ